MVDQGTGSLNVLGLIFHLGMINCPMVDQGAGSLNVLGLIFHLGMITAQW